MLTIVLIRYIVLVFQSILTYFYYNFCYNCEMLSCVLYAYI